jgi:hypothetical protein
MKKMENIEHFNESSSKCLHALYLPDLGRLAPRSLLHRHGHLLTRVETSPHTLRTHEKCFADRNELNYLTHRFLRDNQLVYYFNDASDGRRIRHIANTPLDYLAMQNENCKTNNSANGFIFAHVAEQQRHVTCELRQDGLGEEGELF